MLEKKIKIYKMLFVYFVLSIMLLFGDLHINSRIADRVVDCMKDWISQNSDEQNLIFL
jgi:hypothetical protein